MVLNQSNFWEMVWEMDYTKIHANIFEAVLGVIHKDCEKDTQRNSSYHGRNNW
jgi:hypothetical protein